MGQVHHDADAPDLAVPPETSKNEMADALMTQFKLLDEKIHEIQNQKHHILDQMHKLKPSGPNSATKMVAFVEKMEKACQLLQLEKYVEEDVQYIRHDSDPLQVFKNLLSSKKVEQIYNKLDFEEILGVVEKRILLLALKQRSKVQLKRGNGSSSSCSKDKDSRQIGDPIRNLVYNIREKGYIPKPNPLEELYIIKKHHPDFYRYCFLHRLHAKNSENTVIVRNVPNFYNEDQVKAEFLGSGEISSVELGSEGKWNRVAHVTFEEPEGAKLAAIILKDRHSFFDTEPVLECRQPPTTEELEYAHQKYTTICSDVNCKAQLVGGGAHNTDYVQAESVHPSDTKEHA